MIDLMQSFMAQLAEMPMWIRVWVGWLGLINMLSIVFIFARAETRWAFLAMVVAVSLGTGIFALQGQEMTRLIGLAHIIAWTPLIVYLWRRRGEIYLTHLSGIYLHLLFLTISISLVFDYIDLVRFFMGHSY